MSQKLKEDARINLLIVKGFKPLIVVSNKIMGNPVFGKRITVKLENVLMLQQGIQTMNAKCGRIVLAHRMAVVWINH